MIYYKQHILENILFQMPYHVEAFKSHPLGRLKKNLIFTSLSMLKLRGCISCVITKKIRDRDLMRK